MTTADSPISFHELRLNGRYTEIAARLLELELDLHQFRREDLVTDPFNALNEHPFVSVNHEVVQQQNCSVAGYFREHSDPPTLVIHPSGYFRRDAFTLLHEYGHYLQGAHGEWADILLMLPETEMRILGEKVADAIASEVLLPSFTLPLDQREITASLLRSIFEEQSTASRSAVACKALAQTDSNARLMVAVVADDGRSVIFAQSRGDIMTPACGIEQPAFHRLALRASESSSMSAVARNEESSIRAKSIWKQSGLQLELALDLEGYGFIVGRPEHRFQATSWERVVLECSSAACGETFSPDESAGRCPKCEDWICSECRTCGCEISKSSICKNCQQQLAPGEVAGLFEHECW